MERPSGSTIGFEEIAPVIRMRQGFGESGACEIEAGPKTALFSLLWVEAHFRLDWGYFKPSSPASAWAPAWTSVYFSP